MYSASLFSSFIPYLISIVFFGTCYLCDKVQLKDQQEPVVNVHDSFIASSFVSHRTITYQELSTHSLAFIEEKELNIPALILQSRLFIDYDCQSGLKSKTLPLFSRPPPAFV